ncbi:putative immune-type receptor 6a precursor [Silurus asotus]|uniref:Immune-type receptor 6a n=1 Tax=Silurus asotus TaxID=30991 RepID=A0AAD5B7W5_SILAS|nr:putative immune-type receptor 6a precursor [Silurus asotus]
MISLFVALYSLLCLCTAGENIFKSFISNSNITYLPHLLTSLTIKYHTLFTVKTSDIKELHVRTVKSGQEFTIVVCNISLIRDKSKVVWYRQSFGKVPQFFAKHYRTNSYTFADGFNDNRFSFTVNEHQFNLNITNLREDDEGEYFCGETELTTIKFTSGTRLQFEGKQFDSDKLLIPDQHFNQYYVYICSKC